MKITLVPLRIDLLELIAFNDINTTIFYFPKERDQNEVLDAIFFRHEYADTFQNNISDSERDENLLEMLSVINNQQSDDFNHIIISCYQPHFEKIEKLFQDNLTYDYQLEIIQNPKNRQELEIGTKIYKLIVLGNNEYDFIEPFYEHIGALMRDPQKSTASKIQTELN